VRRTSEDAAQTRQALLNVAGEMFSRQGIAQTSLKSVAAAAGVTHGALYWHFSNRAELVQALYHEQPGALDELYLEQLQVMRQDGLRALRQFLLGWVRLVSEDRSMRQHWMMFHRGCHCTDVAPLAELIGEEQQRWRERLLKLIKQARKHKQLKSKPKRKPDLLADCLLLMVAGLINVRLSQAVPVCDDAAYGAAIDACLRGSA
jgi:TetR/AcrR family acrAB operon transcriptional repressor